MIAGPKERAGFIDAPLIGPANNASSATTAPMATPANRPFSLEPDETLSMTNIKMNVRIPSSISDCNAEPAGMVPPSDL